MHSMQHSIWPGRPPQGRGLLWSLTFHDNVTNVAQWVPLSFSTAVMCGINTGSAKEDASDAQRSTVDGSEYRNIQNTHILKYLDERYVASVLINRSLFGYKCTIQKYSPVSASTGWLLTEQQNYKHIVHYTNSGLGHLLHITATFTNSKAKSENKKQPCDCFRQLGSSLKTHTLHTTATVPSQSDHDLEEISTCYLLIYTEATREQ